MMFRGEEEGIANGGEEVCVQGEDVLEKQTTRSEAAPDDGAAAKLELQPFMRKTGGKVGAWRGRRESV